MTRVRSGHKPVILDRNVRHILTWMAVLVSISATTGCAPVLGIATGGFVRRDEQRTPARSSGSAPRSIPDLRPAGCAGGYTWSLYGKRSG